MTTNTEPIDGFFGEYRFLSNFHRSPILFDGIVYQTPEAAFQAAKTRDPIKRQQIADAKGPRDAKRLGRQLQLRDDWEVIKDSVMLALVRTKFNSDATLGTLLQRTGTRQLVEGNSWGDRYWGVSDGGGLNRLGEILMQVRTEMASMAAR